MSIVESLYKNFSYDIICFILLVVWCFWLACRVDKLEDEVDELKNKKSL